MRRFVILTGASLMLASGAVARSGPAFDCEKARHEVESLVCSDARLAALDRTMDERFKQAHANISQEQKIQLQAEQRGWIKGRNDCWKADDKPACVAREYQKRIVTLEARYGLAEVGASIYYACGGSNGEEVIFTPIATDPPSANIVRRGQVQTMLLEQAGSGSKYVGDFGTLFWIKGDEAQAVWEEGHAVSCARE